MANPQPRPVVAIIGPSACGKSSVVRALHRRQLIRVQPTWTTRPRRPDETDGSLEHRFVSEAVFDAMAGAGLFLDTARLPGLTYRYGLRGLPAYRSARIDVVVARAALVYRLAALFPGLVVYQITDLPDRARSRMLDRGCLAEEVAVRLADHGHEVREGLQLAHRVFLNRGFLGDLVDDVAQSLCRDLGSRDTAFDLRVA